MCLGLSAHSQRKQVTRFYYAIEDDRPYIFSRSFRSMRRLHAGWRIAKDARSVTQTKSSHSPVYTAQPLSTIRDANAVTSVTGHPKNKARYQADSSTPLGKSHRDCFVDAGIPNSIRLVLWMIGKNAVQTLVRHNRAKFCPWEHCGTSSKLESSIDRTKRGVGGCRKELELATQFVPFEGGEGGELIRRRD
jgi:hypothetical protein